MKYVIFLRGVNVGGVRVGMKDLKTLFENNKYANVKTFLQSGNVILESNKIAIEIKAELEDILSKRFSYLAKVQVINFNKLRLICEAYPFISKPELHSYVIFFENDLNKVFYNETKSLVSNSEKIISGDGVIYWQVEKGQTLKSVVAIALTKKRYKDFNTTRNLNTIHKIIYF